MDYDYEHDDYGGRILWGRIVIVIVALMLAFFAGRCSAGGVSEDELAMAQARADALATENAQLQERVQALEGGGVGAAGQPQETASPAPATEPPAEDEQPAEDGEQADTPTTYTVQRNDTLITIAEKVYGDRSLWQRIAEANNLTSETPLQVGQVLEIPPPP